MSEIYNISSYVIIIISTTILLWLLVVVWCSYCYLCSFEIISLVWLCITTSYTIYIYIFQYASFDTLPYQRDIYLFNLIFLINGRMDRVCRYLKKSVPRIRASEQTFRPSCPTCISIFSCYGYYW